MAVYHPLLSLFFPLDMAPRQAKQNIPNFARQRSAPKDESKSDIHNLSSFLFFDQSLNKIEVRPQGVKKKRTQLPPRKSLRIQYRQESTIIKDTNTEPKDILQSQTSYTPGAEACCSIPYTVSPVIL